MFFEGVTDPEESRCAISSCVENSCGSFFLKITKSECDTLNMFGALPFNLDLKESLQTECYLFYLTPKLTIKFPGIWKEYSLKKWTFGDDVRTDKLWTDDRKYTYAVIYRHSTAKAVDDSTTKNSILLMSYVSGGYEQGFDVGDEFKIQEITLIDKPGVEVQHCSCFLLNELKPRAYCLVGYEIAGEHKLEILRQKAEKDGSIISDYKDQMEFHSDLSSLYRNGYATIEWVNFRELKYI